MTTLHTDDVRNIPDRILSMLESRQAADRLENDIYQALDVGVLLRKKRVTDAEGERTVRYIDQMCFFLREQNENKIVMVVKDGEFVLVKLPASVARRFMRAGIYEPFVR